MELRWKESSWEEVRCEVRSLSALVQQISVQLVPRGYWYYVTGTVPAKQEPRQVDRTIIERYGIFEDASGRRRAELKRRGIANVKYLRYQRFYVILATHGEQFFKTRERDRIRCLKKDRRPGTHSKMGRVEHIDQAFPYAPLLVPLDVPARPKSRKKNKKKKSQAAVFEGYSISYRLGQYRRKTAEDRQAYKEALRIWQEKTKQGVQVPRPPRGEREQRWATHTEIEEKSLYRLESYFLEHAWRMSRERLSEELQSTPYEPYWAVREQLSRMLKHVNKKRKAHGLAEVPYRSVMGLQRKQIRVFISDSDQSQKEPRAA